MKQLDYSALPTKPPITQISTVTVVVTIFVACLIGYVAVAFAGDAGMTIVYVSLAVLAIIMYQKTSAIMGQRRALANKLKRFSKDNSFEYTPYQQKQTSPSTLLRLYKNTGTVLHNISGEWCDLPVSIFQFKYAFDQNNYQSQRYDESVMVAELTLPRTFPHIAIDALLPDQLGEMSALPIAFHASQKIKLEGVFYKHFSVYAADNDRITALSIMTPDVMESLLEHAQNTDIEIIDNKLFFYWRNKEMIAADVEEVFTTIAAVMPELQRKLVTANLSQNTDHARLDAKADASRLKQRALAPAPYYAALPLASVLFMLFATWISPGLLWPSLGLVIATIAVYAYISTSKTKTLKKEQAEHIDSKPKA